MKNQTIIHIANYAAPYKGNFIASLETLERQLKENGNNRMVYIFPEECKKQQWIKDFELKRKGCVYFVPSPMRKYYLFLDKNLIFKLEKIFEEEKPNIIHSHFDGYDEYVVKANKMNSKIIWHCHNLRTLVKNPLKKMYQKILLYYQYHIIGKNVSIIILGKEFKKHLEQFGYKKEVFLLPNGIQEKRISFAKKVNNDKTIFLNFGGRANDKGLDILLKAIKILIEKDLKFVVRITEGVDTRKCIKEYFGEKIPTEIEIIPQTEDIANRFHEADWFISSSRRETFSYAIAEAMLSGTPIISSNISGVQWALKQASVISFNNEDFYDLVVKMEQIISGKISINNKNLKDSHEFILENYTATVWAEKIIKYYEKIEEQNKNK